jgi:rod shape-determining protein MreC
MENLLLLLKKISSFLLFLFLELIAVLLIVFNNNYQHSVFSSSMTAVNGNISEITGSISKYFYLTENNEDLLKENSLLREELLAAKAQLTGVATDSLPRDYRVITANVINNSVNNQQNLIILDKGEVDGVRPDMGVICASGVVGIIKTVSDHFSVIIPIIHNQSKISCKLDSSNNFGSLVWEGTDYRYAKLSEIPKHVHVSIGEKISTSGFSSIFPANIAVGEVTNVEEESEQFLSVDVRLSTNFRTLRYVEIMDFGFKQELDSINVTP